MVLISCLRNKNFKLRSSWTTISKFIIITLFISFNMYGIGVREFHGLSIALWDLISILLGLLVLVLLPFRAYKLKINRSFFPALIVTLFFIIWMTICVFFSPSMGYALTMLLQQIRNLFLLVFINVMFNNFVSVESINKKILYAGCGISVISIILYFLFWRSYSEIMSAQELWHPGLIYHLDQGGVMRLVGFAGDPNFYSLFIALPFFIGFTKPLSIRNVIVLTPIGVSIALAMSRGFGIALLISFMFLFVFALVNRRYQCERYIMRQSVLFLVIIILILTFQYLIGYDISQYNKRIQLISESSRWDMWAKILEVSKKNWSPFVGLGLRGIQEILGGQYSHNTYLDILIETGLVGFFIWMLLIIYILICALKALKFPEMLPWIHTYFVMLIMFGVFSLAYNPFFWMLAGVLTSDNSTYYMPPNNLNSRCSRDYDQK